MSRSLRGNVDRNDCVGTSPQYSYVVPYVGTWIEMDKWAAEKVKASEGRSLRGNVDRNPLPVLYVTQTSVVPYVGTWIEISGIRD